MRLTSILLCTLLYCGISQATPLKIIEADLTATELQDYQADPYMTRWEFRLVQVFEWTWGRKKGLLITALPADAEDIEGCVILTKKPRGLSLVAASRPHHRCHWIKGVPAVIASGKDLHLQFENKIDVTGEGQAYSKENLNLIFDKDTLDFCMLEMRMDNRKKCRKF